MSEHRPATRPVDEVVDAVAENQRFSSANQKSEISDDVDESEALVCQSEARRASDDVAATADERERVREALDPVSDGDHITTEAVDTAVSDTAKLVATAETRTELASIAYDDATETAADVSDVPIVDARLESYEERLADVEARAAALGAKVPKPDGLAPETIHQAALALREAATSAQGVATTADDLSWDLEQFESFVEDADRRHEEFAEDLELVEESAAALRSQVEDIDDIAENRRFSAGSRKASTSCDNDEPAVAWAAATMQARVLDLLVVDLRAELEDLETMADAQAEAVPDDLGQRVDALDHEVGVVSTRLTDRAEAAWRERFADELNALGAGLSGLEPPVEWGRVDEVASEQRAAIGVE